MPAQASVEVRNLLFLSAGFAVCVLFGYIAGICTGTGPFIMKTFESTKCLVKRHSGMYEFDDVWHVPMGKKGKPVNCEVFKNMFPMNNSDITMDEIVYAFQIPPFPNESTAEFSKWVPSVEGFLLLDIVLKENGSEELYPQLTFEAKIGYRDKRDGDANWTLIFETTDSRNLQCYANKNGGVQKYQYGCNFVPFFNLDNVYRDFYLINVRFPTDFIGKTSFNYDINYILDLKMLFIYEGIEFIKVMTIFKILCYPFSVALLLWFARHLYYKPLLLMEQVMLCLGTGLVLMNLPMECIRLFKEIPFMPLFEFVRKRFFFAALVVFWSVFCGLFFKNEPEWNHISSYIPSLSPLFFLLAVFLLDLFEKGVQVKNPFFSTWNLAVGIRHWPVFNIISGVLATVYGFFLVGRLYIIFKNSVLARKFYMNTRGARLYKGAVHAFRFVMYLVCTSIFMTLLTYHINQVDEIYIKGNGWNPFEFFSYQTAVYCGVYVLWNYTTFCLIILYAPARRYNPHPEGEEEGN
ncbi:protein wntless [Trichonephila inaurata madagascariensis]|uniref:Protein wntless n=1 Tax=Trichonephila inaurata madagascariensis TaxID=2747483 RepID=A0A8X7CCP0_9ARAC|nr:protein wntless [Trichonephila inaurata madagascariensis]